MLIADYHTHTRWSHGMGSAIENVEAALRLGLKTIAISEHNRGHLLYGVRGKRLSGLEREIEEARDRYGDRIEILLGVEANLLGDGATDLAPGAAARFRPLLLGFHRGVCPRGGAGIGMLANTLRYEAGARAIARNTMAYIHAMERLPGLFAITHPGTYIPLDHKLLARACADHGVLYELNGGHGALDLPSIEAAASVPEARFLLSSDAHAPARVGVVTPALEAAKALGILDRVVNYAPD